MTPLTSNPLCLFTREDCFIGDRPIYRFLASDGTLLLSELVEGLEHRKTATNIAHGLIAASQDALYSRTDGQ